MEAREFEIALYKLELGGAVGVTVPPDADLFQIVELNGAAWAVFVTRTASEEELRLAQVQRDLLERLSDG